MLINKFSSSLAETYKFCAFKYWLTYVLELESSGSGKAATIGTIVHRALEWAALLKKRGKTSVSPEWLFERSWDENPHPDLRKFTSKGLSADYKKAKASFFKVVEDEFYNPYNLTVVDAEKWFEIGLPGQEWEVKKDGETKQLCVRGYIDLIHELDKDTIEIVDYKTGSRNSPFDKNTMDFYNLTKKLQAKIYFMAAKILFPQYKNCVVTFYYTQDLGPTSIGLSDEEIPEILNQLHCIFVRIKGDSLIRRSRSWKCRLCPYEKNDLCTKIWYDLNTLGQEYVTNKYYKLNLDDIK
jgi:ATP-dependent helicase/DNAse subunit B